MNDKTRSITIESNEEEILEIRSSCADFLDHDPFKHSNISSSLQHQLYTIQYMNSFKNTVKILKLVLFTVSNLKVYEITENQMKINKKAAEKMHHLAFENQYLRKSGYTNIVYYITINL